MSVITRISSTQKHVQSAMVVELFSCKSEHTSCTEKVPRSLFPRRTSRKMILEEKMRAEIRSNEHHPKFTFI